MLQYTRLPAVASVESYLRSLTCLEWSCEWRAERHRTSLWLVWLSQWGKRSPDPTPHCVTV